MKCIVIETSPERTNAHPVTDENGTPHIYATMAEARAELKANGYIYNRANQRYYINGTEYRAYILRADSEEYAEIMEQAEQQAAPEYIEPEADAAAARFCAALMEATGVIPYAVETASICKVARDDITHESRSTALDRDAVDLMTEAIAEAARKAAAFEANQAANAAIVDANRAYSEMENRGDNENWQGWAAQFIAQAERSAAEAARLAVVANDKTITAKAGAVSAMTRRVREEIAAAAPIYQRHELLAYLGEPDDYDVDAIEAEATRFTADGRRIWSAFGEDLAAIAERHQVVTYYAI